MKPEIVLFDADGVLILPEEIFSKAYSRSRGLALEPFEQFFRNDWKPIVTGKADLKESIAANPELWQWPGTIDDLLTYWFEVEDVRNEELMELVRELKKQGIQCYLATEQEKYRGDYMRDVMFKDLFDGYYITAELGVSKTEPKFFQMIIDDLEHRNPGVRPENIVFFDDSQSKVDTAHSVGIDAHLYTDVEQVRRCLLG
ncbi:MAG TPA: HAD family hydrolase [Verrucomicrobiae bacterium]|nr:HAD family hydrolase [Verrucomicrobiae bacterium]